MPSVPSAEQALAGDQNIIDLSILAEMLSGHFVQRFIASSKTDIAEIEQALGRNDMEALGARMMVAIGFANLVRHWKIVRTVEALNNRA